MNTISVTFPISISPCGDLDVDVKLTTEQFMRLKSYVEKLEEQEECALEDEESDEVYDDDFSNVEELSDIFQLVLVTTYDRIANDVCNDEWFIDQYLDGEYDYDKARACVEHYYDIGPMFPSYSKLEEQDGE